MPYRVPDRQTSFARRLRRDMTEAETMLWRSLRSRALDGLKFRRQVPGGRYVVDFLCVEHRLIVELDGPPHDGEKQKQHDATRDSWLRERGYCILRVRNDGVDGPASTASKRQGRGRRKAPQGGEPSMNEFSRIGVDLAKNYVHVHALEGEGGRAVSRQLTRAKVFEFFRGAAPCLVGLEACGAAPYRGRELAAMGHEVKLIPPSCGKPGVKRGTNGGSGAEACGEAGSRPAMRFVPVNSVEQQAAPRPHKTRAQLIKQRPMTVNAPRGHLPEFGAAAAKGSARVEELVERAGGDAISLRPRRPA
jgi:very-short-patch-repair endonuclease